jgi:16S rRNA C967 or C1407 C5-methylase (RsmB/RsmF family)
MGSSSKEPSRNILKVANAIFPEEGEREVFLGALQEGQSSITAVAWLRGDPQPGLYELAEKPAWLPTWIDVTKDGERPGRTESHDRGDFYCLDLSSLFACAPLAILPERVPVVVDVCAAPGGKGIIARRYGQTELLIGNEVIRKRTAQLISNYKRCGIDPAIVTSVDPKLLGSLLAEKAQLVVVDAPCSGQSLVLKDLAAPGAFHPATISMNERRQRRILAHSRAIVLPGGYLLYATCTFSPEENEENVAWFVKTFPEFATVEVPALQSFQSGLTDLRCYRLFPQHGMGAGAFCCLLRREGEWVEDAALSAENVTEAIRPVWRSPSVFEGSPPPKSTRDWSTKKKWQGRKKR